jgi:hypothetical protein
MAWYNPFSWLKEDPVTRCGWRALSIYGNPKEDPYYDFCEWDDNATTKGSLESQIVPLTRHIQAGLDQLNEIQKRYPHGSEAWLLGQFYKKIWPHVVGFFWEGN